MSEDWEEELQKYLTMGLYQPALDMIEEILQKDKNNKKAKTYKAYILRSLERDDEALEIVDSLLKEGEDEDLLLLKGMILYDNEKYKEAAKYFRRVTEINPENIDAWYNLASCYDALEEYPISEKYYRKLVEINPEDAEAWNNLSVTLLFQDKYEEALKAAEKAIEIEEDYDNAWYNKGLALHYLERYKEAIKAFDRCIKISDDPDAWYAKGISYLLMGKKEEARKYLREALKRNPEDEEIREALESIENE